MSKLNVIAFVLVHFEQILYVHTYILNHRTISIRYFYIKKMSNITHTLCSKLNTLPRLARSHVEVPKMVLLVTTTSVGHFKLYASVKYSPVFGLLRTSIFTMTLTYRH